MYLLTGGTGFLGRELLGRLLVRDPSCRVILLLRGESDEEACLRAKTLLSELFSSDKLSSYLDRVEAFAGDLALEKFGWGDEKFNRIAKRLKAIFHCAASTSLIQSYQSARATNFLGTENVVALAKLASKSQRCRLHHVSTAYVAGDGDSVVSPDSLRSNAIFRNGYERSKAEAEGLVRGASEEVPSTIYRPSIIVGDSRSGYTSAFNVLYIPAKLLARGLLCAVPANPSNPFDVVPVDYVADALIELSHRKDSVHETFHLTAGVGRETNPSEILDCLIRTIERFRGTHGHGVFRPPFLSDDLVSLVYHSLVFARERVKHIEVLVSEKLNVIRQLIPFVPYMIRNPQFDSSKTDKALGDRISPPLFASYGEKMFSYCIETDWGKFPKSANECIGGFFNRFSERPQQLPVFAGA